MIRETLEKEIPWIIVDTYFKHKKDEEKPGGNLASFMDETGYDIGEGWMTNMALGYYGAKRLGAWKNPFPISHEEDGMMLQKNGAIQIFQGYSDSADVDESDRAPPSEEMQAKNVAFIKSANWHALRAGGQRRGAWTRISISTLSNLSPRTQSLLDQLLVHSIVLYEILLRLVFFQGGVWEFRYVSSCGSLSLL